jgi:hypothetical protein
MVLSCLLYTNLNLIPAELTAREYSVTVLIGVGLLVSFLLVSTARLMKSKVYSTLVISFTKIRGLYTYAMDTHKLNKRESVVLYSNYLVTFGLALIVVTDIIEIELGNEIIIAAIIPVILLGWPIACMLIVGLLTGERRIFMEPIMMKLIGAQLLGAIYSLCLLTWALGFINGIVLTKIVLWAFIVESIFRIIKSIRIVYFAGVSWYYIILYLCTLEILPLWLMSYSLLKEFNGIGLFVN